MADKDADEEWKEDALYEIVMAAAVVTVTASCTIIAAKKRRKCHDLSEADISEACRIRGL